LSGGGRELLPPMLTSRMTVTVMLPGFTVSVQSAHAPPPAVAAGRRPPARPLALRLTVVLWPEASVPADGETVTRPTRLDDSVIDQSTEPNEAVRVSVPPFSPSTIVVGVTVSTPRLGAELGGELAGAGALEVLAAGELAFALDGADVFGAGFPL
jgi:hypothetical protein